VIDSGTDQVHNVSAAHNTVHIILQTPWLYGSYEASCLYLVVIFSWGTWNGASYYIEVFSEQYKLQFLKVPIPR
jgi:hypothetical protein